MMGSSSRMHRLDVDDGHVLGHEVPAHHMQDVLAYLRTQGAGFRVQGSGFRGWGSGFRVQGLEFVVQNFLAYPHVS